MVKVCDGSRRKLGFGGWVKQDTKDPQIPEQRQGPAMLDCALTVPASRLGKRQPFLPLRGDPAESLPTMVADPGPARLGARHVSPHQPFNSPVAR